MLENYQKFSGTSRWSFQTSLIFWLFFRGKLWTRVQICTFIRRAAVKFEFAVWNSNKMLDVSRNWTVQKGVCLLTQKGQAAVQEQHLKSLELLRLFSKSNLTRCHRDLWGPSDSHIILPNLLRFVMSKVLQHVIVVMRCQESPWSALCLSNCVSRGQKEIYIHLVSVQAAFSLPHFPYIPLGGSIDCFRAKFCVKKVF